MEMEFLLRKFSMPKWKNPRRKGKNNSKFNGKK
jgi:hypothetical protein